ncbi:MAG: hypothetical protein R2755_11325 [Acidimicrobiales bacterium]
MLTPEVRVFPGVPAELRFEVANTGDVVDSVALDMPRVNKAWLSKPEEHLALFPAATGELSVLLTVPESHPQAATGCWPRSARWPTPTTSNSTWSTWWWPAPSPPSCTCAR